MRNGKCKLHHGKSTGPKIEAGIERIHRAQRRRWVKWRANKAAAGR